MDETNMKCETMIKQAHNIFIGNSICAFWVGNKDRAIIKLTKQNKATTNKISNFGSIIQSKIGS